jgi:hypothetical protein
MDWKRTTFLAGAMVIAAGVLSGCGATYKTRPHDLTVRGHEDAAASEDAEAKRSADAAEVIGRGSANARAMVTHHHELAESHRAAANALRDKEAKACAGVAPETAARADVPGASLTTVDAIRERPLVPGGRVSAGYVPVYLRGARLTLRGEGGQRDIERVLACRIARFAAAGDDGVDPVAVRGASASVRPGEEGSVVVELRAADETAAAEVLRRARALASR